MILGTIELTDAEAALLAEIEFYARTHDALVRSCRAAARLTPLLDRGAIPEQRLRYFFDPDYHIGKRSRCQIFESNGTVGDEIFGHGNFLRHLRYFVHGSALTDYAKQTMSDAVGDPAHFTGGDLEPIRKLARATARRQGLNSSAADDFFQLMNDLGLNADHAHSVRHTILSLR